MKVVFNACFGGFGLSPIAEARYVELKGELPKNFYQRNIKRDDPVLVQVVEELGKAANGSFADLKIIDVPAGTRWRIDEYDGSESVMAVDDYEWSIAT